MAIISGFLWKGILVALGGVAAWELAANFGPLMGLALWAGLMAIACVGSAWLLKTSPVGQVNWHNRVGEVVLPWGYPLSAGKLMPLATIAWLVWVAIGAAAVVLQCSATAKNPSLAVLLFVTWMLYGGCCLRQLGLIFHHFRNSPRPRRSMIVLTAVMIGIVVVSLVLWRMDRVRMALLVADGPLAVVGGGYGLFLASMLAFRGKGRWN